MHNCRPIVSYFGLAALCSKTSAFATQFSDDEDWTKSISHQRRRMKLEREERRKRGWRKGGWRKESWPGIRNLISGILTDAVADGARSGSWQRLNGCGGRGEGLSQYINGRKLSAQLISLCCVVRLHCSRKSSFQRLLLLVLL